MQAPLLHEGLENQLLIMEDHLERVGSESGSIACIKCWQVVSLAYLCNCEKPIYWPLRQAVIRLRNTLANW